MINYMQSNQLLIINIKIINFNIYIKISELIQKKNIKNFYNELQILSITYNIDIKNIIKDYFNYIIRHQPQYISNELLNTIEYIIHNPELNIEYQIKYIFYSFQSLLS